MEGAEAMDEGGGGEVSKSNGKVEGSGRERMDKKGALEMERDFEIENGSETHCEIESGTQPIVQ